MVPLPAYANNFLIDDFSNDGADGVFEEGRCDIARNILGTAMPATQQMVTAFNTTVLGVLGDFRFCSLELDAENPPVLAIIEVVAFSDDPGPIPHPNVFRHTSQIGVETISMLSYNADGAGLGVDLTNSVNLRIKYSQAQFQVDGTAKLTDSGGDSASLPFTLAAGINSLTELNIPLANFVAQNANLNLNDIDEIKLTFDTTVDATDYSLDLIDINMLIDPDSDGDGVPDSQDICPNFDDNIDTDGDGVPDGCDENPTLSCGPGTQAENLMCVITKSTRLGWDFIRMFLGFN